MNTRLALALALLTPSLSAQAQNNYVIFQNGGVSFPTMADRFVYEDYVGGHKLVGSNYVASLWYVLGDDAAAVDGRVSPDRGVPSGRVFPFRGPATTQAGTWLVPSGSSSVVFLNGAMPLDRTMLQVRVWDAEKFGSYAAAFAAGEYGASAPFSYVVPPTGAAGGPQAYYMDNLRAFALAGHGDAILVNDIVAAEGSNGVAQANFHLRLSSAQSGPVSVHYATQDGTALAGQDYLSTNGMVIFAPGETVKTISITLTADAPPEDDEVFYLQLSDPANAVLARRQAACTITEIRIVGLSFDTTVSFNTVHGHHYIVERTGDTLHWEPVPGATNVLGTGEIVSIVDRGAAQLGMRAYRARLLDDN